MLVPEGLPAYGKQALKTNPASSSPLSPEGIDRDIPQCQSPSAPAGSSRGGGASASLLSTKQASLAGAADSKHSSIPQPLWSTVREQGEAEHCCFPPSSFWISGCSCDLFKRATNFNTTHTLQNTHNVRV